MKYKFILAFCLLPCLLWGQNTLNVSSGSFLVGSNGSIVLKDAEFINNGTFTAGTSTVVMTGTGSDLQSAIGGSSTTTFYNLMVNKSVNNATLEQPTNVSNTLSFTAGQLDVKSSNLTVLSGGAISGSSSSNYVRTSNTGTLIQEVGGTAVLFPIGNSSYNPVTISNTGILDNFSSLVKSQILSEGTTGTPFTSEIVNRTWIIDEEIPGGSNLTLTLSWSAGDELSGFLRSDCYISHYTAGDWDQIAKTADAGSNPYTQTRSGITSLSPFAVTGSNPLPVELLSFEAFKENQTTVLEWRTASEINNAGFYVEHSTDSDRTFDRLGFVEGAGNSSEELDYSFVDKDPESGMNYYRLKQVDSDGSYVYTEVKAVYFDKKMQDIVLFPNPVSKGSAINLAGLPESDDLSVQIYAINGQLVFDKSLANTPNAELWLWHLASATYIYTIKNGNEAIATGRLVLSDKMP